MVEKVEWCWKVEKVIIYISLYYWMAIDILKFCTAKERTLHQFETLLKMLQNIWQLLQTE